MDIHGSNVVITGGASGIGAGMARRFASLGAKQVVIADLDESGATTVAEEVSSLGAVGVAVACDATSESSVASLVERASAAGPIDLFCANAGVGAGGGLDTSLETWDLTLRVNVLGPVIAAKHVIPLMESNGGGTFLITASAAGLITGPTGFNYAVSKHAAVGVAEWLALNHSATVTVSCLCPTLVETPMAVHFDGLQGAMTVDDVVDAAVDGLADDRFLILPAPMPLTALRAKADDYDGFIKNMSEMIAALDR